MELLGHGLGHLVDEMPDALELPSRREVIVDPPGEFLLPGRPVSVQRLGDGVDRFGISRTRISKAGTSKL